MISQLKRISLSAWIIIAMIAGVFFGLYCPKLAIECKFVSTVFLHLIKCIIVPLLFSTLVVGIAGHADDLKSVGKLAFRSILYFEVVTTAALLIGLLAVNLIRPGDGVHQAAKEKQASATTNQPAVLASQSLTATNLEVAPTNQSVALAGETLSATNLSLASTNQLSNATNGSPAIASAPQISTNKITFAGVVEHAVPQSFFESAAKNDVLQIVVFAIIFAIALGQVSGQPKKTMLAFLESLSEVMFKFTGLVMWVAPFGVAAAIASTIGTSELQSGGGFRVLLTLLTLVLTLYGALLVFILIVLVPIMLIARIPILRFLKTVREPVLLAFSTASSEAALPDALRLMEKFGVPKRIVAFVLPTGYSFNLDGSTLYLALASVFVAQAAGIELTLQTQVMMMLTLMLTTKGVAAVPRASLVILSGTLTSFGLPLEGVALILGVDAFMDMARTSVNLLGNCLASAVMARWEGELKLAPESKSDDLEIS